jgi:hypothetical protein
MEVIEKTKRLAHEHGIIAAELPRNGRWGWKNPFIYLVMAVNSLVYAEWGLIPILSGRHLSLYKNYSMNGMVRLFESMGFGKHRTLVKSDFRKAKGRSTSDDTLFGIFIRA